MQTVITPFLLKSWWRNMYQTKRTDEFTAQDEQGNSFRIVEYTDIVPTGTYGNPGATEDGLKSLQLETGGHVNLNPDGTYTIVSTGQLLVRR
jgi:hypothetical protein